MERDTQGSLCGYKVEGGTQGIFYIVWSLVR